MDRGSELLPVAGGARGALLRFLALFLFLLLLLSIVWNTQAFQEHVNLPSRRFNARVAAGILNALGETVNLRGTTLASATARLHVGPGCDALGPLLVFAFAIAAVPAAIPPKLLGIGLGAPLLWLLNELRTVSLYYASAHRPAWFEILHQDVGQALYIVACASVWVAWGTLVLRRVE